MSSFDLLAGTAATPRVLIVEDDPVSAMLVQRLLMAQGIHTDRAIDGVAAIQMHAEHKYRLVISDWMMPKLSGVDLCRELRRVGGSYVYFILCSAKGQRADRIEAFEAGVDDFLSKPLDRSELDSRLKVARRILQSEHNLQIQTAELESAARSLSDMNESLGLASRRFEGLFNGLPVACFTFDESGLVHEWNRGAQRIFGVAGFEAFQKPVWEVLNRSGETPWNRDKVAEVFAGAEQPTFDWIFTLADGSQKYLACSLICLRSASGQAVGAVCANLDITERKLAERRIAEQIEQINEFASQLATQKNALEEMNERLNVLAVTDGLTGLWNHRRFQELLEETFATHDRRGEAFSLILLDIDHFKRFNDDFGHQVGDEVLKGMGNVLRKCARQFELPARYGGEEFAVILEGCNEEDAMRAAERFRAQIAANQSSDKNVTASLGVATCHPRSSNPKDLIAQADGALYYSKQAGRNCATHHRDVPKQAAA